MWNMMCDVMPTISEDSISQRSSQFGGGGGGAGGADDANFEQLMVSMLDERDKLVDSLKNEQEKTAELEARNRDLEKERDSLNRQLNQNLPQVSPHPFHPLPPCREREGAPLFWSESPLAASKHPPPALPPSHPLVRAFPLRCRLPPPPLPPPPAVAQPRLGLPAVPAPNFPLLSWAGSV